MGFKLAFRLADRVLADSGRVKSLVQSRYSVSSSKISVLPIAGVDTDRYRPMDVQSADDCLSVATVGRLTPEKGFDDLFRCARQLGTDFQFYIAGDGPERERMEANSPANVTLCGTIPNDEIPAFLSRHDIYFQPSKREGLCMTVIEAMACGVPVVASAVGGITESVIPDETGFLCDAGDVECFCDRLERFGTDQKLRERFGRSGRQRIISEYSQSVLAEKFRTAVERTKTV